MNKTLGLPAGAACATSVKLALTAQSSSTAHQKSEVRSDPMNSMTIGMASSSSTINLGFMRAKCNELLEDENQPREHRAALDVTAAPIGYILNHSPAIGTLNYSCIRLARPCRIAHRVEAVPTRGTNELSGTHSNTIFAILPMQHRSPSIYMFAVAWIGLLLASAGTSAEL